MVSCKKRERIRTLENMRRDSPTGRRQKYLQGIYESTERRDEDGIYSVKQLKLFWKLEDS